MTADPEPDDLVILQKPKGSVGESHANSVERVAVVDPFELKTWVPGVLAKQTVGFPREVLDLRWQRYTPPRSAASPAISQLLGVEFGRSAGRVVRSCFSRELRQGVLGGSELAGPLLVIAELVEQPARDTVLFLGRQRRKLGNRHIKRTGHETSIPKDNEAAQQAFAAVGGRCDHEPPPRLKRGR